MACMVPQQSSPVLPSRTCSGWLNTSIPRFSYFAAGLGDKTHVLNFFCFFLYFFFLCVVQINCKETKYRTTPMNPQGPGEKRNQAPHNLTVMSLLEQMMCSVFIAHTLWSQLIQAVDYYCN
jgi:hypothetical protein